MPLEYFYADDHKAVSANHSAVMTSKTDVSVLFYHARPPVFPGDPEEVAKKAAELPHVTARCVSEVVMSVPAFIQFAAMIGEQARRIVSEANRNIEQMQAALATGNEQQRKD